MDALVWRTVIVIGREGPIVAKSRNYSTDKSASIPSEANLKCSKKPKFCPSIPPLFSPRLPFSDPLKYIWINKTSQEEEEGGGKPGLSRDESLVGLSSSGSGVRKTSLQIDESNAEEEEESKRLIDLLSSDDSQAMLADQSGLKSKEPHDSSGFPASQGNCVSPYDEGEPENPNHSDKTSHVNWFGRTTKSELSWKEENKCDSNSSSNAASSWKPEPCTSQEIDYSCNSGPHHPIYSSRGREDFLCNLRKQVSINEVTHDRDSFSRLLHAVSLPDTRLYAKMAFLCDQAYSIPQIKPAELWKFYQLRYVTSSLVKTPETTAKVACSMSASNTSLQSLSNSSQTREGNSRSDDGTEFRPSVSPRVAYEIAASAASYLHSQTKFFLPFKSQRRNEVDSDENLNTETKHNGTTDTDDNQMKNATEKDAEDTALVQISYRDAQQEVTNSQQAEPSEFSSMSNPEMAATLATSSITTPVASEEGATQVAMTDLQSLHPPPPPCEWFICDDDRRNTRYFVIQGSSSLASWQANLFFEPTQFEGFEVLVHRGIYEAAKGMYEQLLPKIVSHLRRHGENAKFRFIGHSLGGSLSLLLNLMLLIRGVALKTSLLPVITFGSPCVMCGGDYLLQKLGLPNKHVQAVMIHRDIVPRSFACTYPDHVAEVLKRVNISFRDHPCLNFQKILYGPMGELLILQPDRKISPPHPLLPSGCGFYVLHHIKQDNDEHKNELSCTLQLQAAQRDFLNSPHPLEILGDKCAYGPDGSISRDHDSSNYLKVINYILRQHRRKSRREQRRQSWQPSVTVETPMCSKIASKAAEEDSEMSEDFTSICK